MGFTTDMSEIDIVYGAEEKLFKAIRRTAEEVRPRAVFVYATCVSGLTGEDIEAVCRKAENELDIRVIAVNAPGFVGPKNLGNRIAGEVLLDSVIGTGEPPVATPADINLIGEYNIAGDLWQIEPILEKAGIRILSRITGNSTFEEITWAHRAQLNVVVCGRALVNVAREMERRYGTPFVEVSFYGRTETTKALRAIGSGLSGLSRLNGLNRIEAVIRREEKVLKEALKPYKHLRGGKAVLYTGGVKSWSFISALQDLGIEVVAVGTKKSTVEDEEKMRSILGPDAPLVEDVAPKKLLKLLKERGADMLIAGGRNQYLAAKEGYPFVDVNQERHTAYAGYRGLVNLAKDISNSLRFYGKSVECGARSSERKDKTSSEQSYSAVKINPLKHSQSIGAAMALQGIDGALPLLHGTQGCTFLAKVLLTRHFREPIALVSSKLFAEDVVMGSEDRLAEAIEGFIEKNRPSLLGVLTTGLTEIKGDDVKRTIDGILARYPGQISTRVVHVSTPDFEGGLESGYAKAVESVIRSVVDSRHPTSGSRRPAVDRQINILAGSHLTPADCNEIRDIIDSFGLEAIMLPDLSALDGSRHGFSPLASGGTGLMEIAKIGRSKHTIAIGMSMEQPARLIQEKTGVGYAVLPVCAGLAGTDKLLQLLSEISGKAVPVQFARQRRILADAMRDAHSHVAGRKICIALESDLAAQTSSWAREMGADVNLAVIPALSESAAGIEAGEVIIGDLFSIQGSFDLLIAGSHGEATAKKLNAAHYEIGFPVYKSFGYTARVTIGYRGTLAAIHDVANLIEKHSWTVAPQKEEQYEGSICHH
jgi:nitrogenase molybdenum-cofactor synthesis protein NifE